MSDVVQLSSYSTRPFSYSAGDSFRLALSFAYDVTSVLFELKIFDASGAAVKTFGNADWTLSGTRKKILLKAPADMNLAAGTYRMVLRHTFPDTSVKKRIDSQLTIHD